jgi:hypothetical protein
MHILNGAKKIATATNVLAFSGHFRRVQIDLSKKILPGTSLEKSDKRAA